MKITEVKRFSNKAYDALVRLIPQLGPDVVVPDKRHFREVIGSDTTHFYILELDNGNIAGILSLCIYPIPTGTKAWIEDVVVDEALRGNGYGRILMLHAIEYARSTGAKAIELTSRPSRIAANQLYRELGFIIRETNLYKFTIVLS